MIGKYRKKPVTVEALQWTGDNIKEVDQFVGCEVSCRAWDRVLYLYINEKTYPMNRMDYIIKEPNGRVYPCSWETFQETYEELGPEEYRVGQRGGKALLLDAKSLTVQEFMHKHPDFVRPILFGGYYGNNYSPLL